MADILNTDIRLFPDKRFQNKIIALTHWIASRTLPFPIAHCIDQADFLHTDLKPTLERITSKQHNCYDALWTIEAPVEAQK